MNYSLRNPRVDIRESSYILFLLILPLNQFTNRHNVIMVWCENLVALIHFYYPQNHPLGPQFFDHKSATKRFLTNL